MSPSLSKNYITSFVVRQLSYVATMRLPPNGSNIVRAQGEPSLADIMGVTRAVPTPAREGGAPSHTPSSEQCAWATHARAPVLVRDDRRPRMRSPNEAQDDTPRSHASPAIWPHPCERPEDANGPVRPSANQRRQTRPGAMAPPRRQACVSAEDRGRPRVRAAEGPLDTAPSSAHSGGAPPVASASAHRRVATGCVCHKDGIHSRSAAPPPRHLRTTAPGATSSMDSRD